MTTLTRPRRVRRPSEARTVRPPGLWSFKYCYYLRLHLHDVWLVCRAATQSAVSKGVRLVWSGLQRS